MASKQIAHELIQIRIKDLGEVAENEFTISYPLQLPALIQSIRKFGLIQPLLVCLKDGAYQLVCGHRRLLACRELGYDSVACLFIADKSSFELLQIAIYGNLSTRQFNPVEKANAICRLLDYLPKEKVIGEYLPVLGLQPHYKILAKYLDIAKLAEKLKQAIISGRIHEEVAFQLTKWPISDQLILADIFTNIPFSVSSQQEVISNIWEISRREDIPLSGILAAREVVELLKDNSLSGPQKGYNLRRYLIKRRYPELSLTESKFKQYLSQLQLPQDTKLIPPAYFETSKFKLECSFTSLQQLNKQLLTLSKTMQNKAWQAILRFGIKDDL